MDLIALLAGLPIVGGILAGLLAQLLGGLG